MVTAGGRLRFREPLRLFAARRQVIKYHFAYYYATQCSRRAEYDNTASY